MPRIKKFNGGYGAICCSECEKIVKEGWASETNSGYNRITTQDWDSNEPIYCEKCKKNFYGKFKKFLEIKKYFAKNWIIMLWAKMLVDIFKYKYDESVVPNDIPYCYSPDKTKNAMKTISEEGVYYTETCPYYKPLGKYYNGCMLLGMITDDMVFDDQCKMCDISDGFDDEEK